jgi:signal transduction histidine kinase
VELALFRIVQEAMTNVAKHARATGVVLTEAENNGTVRLVIADNGVGFDQARLGQPGGRHLWGLMTMSERAAAAGGRCRIDSQPGQGTRVVVELSR